MKDPIKLQNKLQSLLKKVPQLKIMFPEKGKWSVQDLTAVAWVVQDFVNQNPDVIEDGNPLRDWLDETKFFLECYKR